MRLVTHTAGNQLFSVLVSRIPTTGMPRKEYKMELKKGERVAHIKS